MLNPSNKLIVGSFLILFLVVYCKLRDLRLSLLLTFLASSILFIGKTYVIQLVAPGIYDVKAFPDGYLLFRIIAPSHVIAAVMVFVMAADVLKKKIKPTIFNKLNILLLVYFFVTLASDLLASKRPDISFYFNLLGLNGIILYFYLQSYVKNINKFVPLLIGILLSFVVFESLISFQQFINKAPVSRNLEYQKAIESWGTAPDEEEFAFRIVGTFHHANSLAADLVFWLTLILTAYLKIRDKNVFYVLSIGFVCLIATLSRSSWLGFAASVLSILFVLEKLKKTRIRFVFDKRIIPLVIILPVLFYFFVLPRALKSLYSFNEGGGVLRIEQVRATLQIIRSRPLLGVGKKMLVSEGLVQQPESIFGYIPLDVHNWYLSQAAEHGIPAFILLMTFVLLSAKRVLAQVIKGHVVSYNEFVRVALLGGLAAFLILGMFQVTSGELYIFTLLGLLNKGRT
jgi:hypothetical protein